MLEVEGLNAGYGRIPILNGIDFSIARGEIVGVLGHNGMGKTTLLRTLMGEIRATGGSIVFEDEDITRLAMHRRARLGIGYVPQGRDIYPQLSVMDNLRMGEIVRRGQSAVPELLDYFPVLGALLERPGRALSGGEQQILALARCLAGRPSLLLLDEPTEGIQPSIIKDIEKVIRLLGRRGDLAVLLVEQYYELACDLADDIAVMERGRILLSGPIGDFEEADIRRHLTV